MTGTTRGFIGMLAVAALSSGCVKATAPFDQIKDASVIAFRLQNYEPPVAATPAPATPVAGILPGLPPEIQQWAQQGAQSLGQLMPGLIPEGILQGLGGAAPAATAVTTDNALRYPETPPNFRVLGQSPVMDPKLKKQLMAVFGKQANFQQSQASCLYAEFGVRFVVPPSPPNDVLVSFSCNQVAARGFAWPYAGTGLKPDTVEKLADVINKLFPPGT
ncbi:MAG TPA: hypothetical protein PLU22_01600 [Polyangiaceae bacterium]|nr:hypothetical protein [Polyangiaceae bacterium]